VHALKDSPPLCVLLQLIPRPLPLQVFITCTVILHKTNAQQVYWQILSNGQPE